MSLAVVLSRGLAGLEAPLVTVECHAGNGLPAFNLVGRPEIEVKEARDRVRAALQNAQFDFPPRKIVVQWLYNWLRVGIDARKPFARVTVHGAATRRPLWVRLSPHRWVCQESG